MKKAIVLSMIVVPIALIAWFFIYGNSPTEHSAEKPDNSKEEAAVSPKDSNKKPDPHITPKTKSTKERQFYMVDNKGDHVEVSHPTPKGKASNSDPTVKEPVKVEQETTADVYNEDGKKVGKQKISQDFIDGKEKTSQTENAPQAQQTPKAQSAPQAQNTETQAAPGAKQVMTVQVVADEEYRAANPDWMRLTTEIMEKTNQPFMRDHKIDFKVQAFAKWKSDGANNQQLLDDLDRDWNRGKFDFVVGFTKDRSFNMGGIAYVYPSAPTGSAVSLNVDQGSQLTPFAVQHELSHNLGLNHDQQGSGIKCIMNYDTMYKTDTWDTDHNHLINKNKKGYGHSATDNEEDNDNNTNDENNDDGNTNEEEKPEDPNQDNNNEDTNNEDNNNEEPNNEENNNEDNNNEDTNGDTDGDSNDDTNGNGDDDTNNNDEDLQGLSDYEKKVVELVNQERQKNNLNPLAVDTELSKVARIKSEDMKEKDYFHHQSPTYGSPSDMLKRFNISFRYGGENLGSFYAAPEDIVAAWMYSPNHRKNILNPCYTHIGVGHVTGGHFAVYWTQLFIAK
ncbi:CAP domain-containing protein [Salinithrix halophila]|uniref:CAP domain-containing protein n=1 Tax=Salinithrix halophila TaxID=1485204 RepID=A0ABV8JIE7_9BACL